MEKRIHSNRRHDLDWLRVMAILILVFFHSAMFYNTYDFHIKNAETTHSLDIITTFLHQWRMPLLLFISGVGTMFAFGKRSSKQYLFERSRRLLVPLLFSMLIIVPPQIFVERIDSYTSYWTFYKSIFSFIPYPEGNLSWHHMWFVMYLFLYSIIVLPLVQYIRAQHSKRFRQALERVVRFDWGFMLYLIPIMLSQLLLKPIFPLETHALVDDWAYFTLNLFFFIAGMLIANNGAIWLHLKNRRHFHLVLGLGSLGLMVILMSISWDQLQPFLRVRVQSIWDMNNLVVAWSWVLTILGYGNVYLNKRSLWIIKANEGIYPFYILHQTVLILVAYPLINLDINIELEYLILSTSTVLISTLIYLIMIRPYRLTRFLFGMKPLRSSSKKTTDNDVNQIANKQKRNRK